MMSGLGVYEARITTAYAATKPALDNFISIAVSGKNKIACTIRTSLMWNGLLLY